MTPDGELVLGVDLATAAVRVLAVDVTTGAVAASADMPLPAPTSPRPGELEQQPAHVAAVRTVLRRLTGELGPRAGAVRALSVTATSGSVLAADAAGTPTGPVLLYADQRGAPQAARISAATGQRVAARWPR